MKSLKKSILAATFVMAAFASQAQLKVGSNPTAIHADANLDVESTNGKRFLVTKSSGDALLDGKFFFERLGDVGTSGTPLVGFAKGTAEGVLGYGSWNDHAFYVRGNADPAVRISQAWGGSIHLNGKIYYARLGDDGANGSPLVGSNLNGSVVNYGGWDGHSFFMRGTANPTLQMTPDWGGSVLVNGKLYFYGIADNGWWGVPKIGISLLSGGPVGTGYGSWDGHSFYVRGGQFPTMRVAENDMVGIGTEAPTQKLHVIGNILASGTITPSDARFKENVVGLSGSLNKLTQLRGVSYTHKAEFIKDRGLKEGNQIGFIAQELEQIFPEFVVTSSDGYKAVDYARLTPVLVESLKEVNAKLEAQQAEINELKASVNALLKK